MPEKLKKLPLSPFLIGLWFILFLWVRNSTEAPFSNVILPILVTLLLTLLLLLVLKLALKNWAKASILSTLLVLEFFLFRYIKNPVPTLFGERYTILILILVLLGVAAFVLIKLRSSNRFLVINVFLSLVSLILLLYLPFNYTSQNKGYQPIILDLESKEKPSIYHIILDEYAGKETLLKYWSYDNTWFLRELEERGFYIVESSRSNYDWTKLSLTSMFRMEYLVDDGNDQDPVGIYYNTVEKSLKKLGYKFIIVTNEPWGGMGTEAKMYQKASFIGVPITSFTKVLIQETPLEVLNLVVNYQREEALYAIQEAPKIIKNEEKPLFALIYLQIPHRPFLFTSTGEPMVNNLSNSEKYLEQLKFASTSVLKIIDELPRYNSIIILQSDTGPGSYNEVIPLSDDGNGRVETLSSFYFEDRDYRNLYKGMSSVNTYRVVFDKFFSTNLGLLEDKSYVGFPENTKEVK